MATTLNGVVLNGNTNVEAFSPSALFAAGEQGVWYDPSDWSTLFQDDAGTTPVTAVEQTVGRMLDKSGRGNHATQATLANRPTLSARVNLLTKTKDYSDAVWVKGTSSNATSATATKLSAASSGVLTFLQAAQTLSKAAVNTSFIASVEVKEAELRYFGFALQNFASGTNGIYTQTDIRDGSQIGQGTFGSGFTLTSVTRSLLADGYVRIVLTGTSSTETSITVAVQPAKNSTFTSTSYTAGEGMLVRNADLRVSNDGVNIPAYQRVNTSTDYDTGGFPMYLRFDGSNDSMATSSIDFSGTDEMTVVSGVRKLSDTATGIIAELGTDTATINGSFLLAYPRSNTVNAPNYASRGTVTATGPSTSNSYTSPLTSVVTGQSDISTDALTLRLNGTQIGSLATDQGTGNYGNLALYIGARGGSSLYFNGRLYSLIIRGATTTAADIAKTETFVNYETKAY